MSADCPPTHKSSKWLMHNSSSYRSPDADSSGRATLLDSGISGLWAKLKVFSFPVN